MFDDFFEKARELRLAGAPFATAVVVRAEKPTSGKPGDRAIVTMDGTMFGWIGGSCAQPTVVREALEAIADGKPRLVRLSPDPAEADVEEGMTAAAMTCFSGGTLDIFIQPQQPVPHLLVVGTLPVARATAHLGKAMSYRVTALVPAGDETMTMADELIHDAREIPARITPLTFVVVATHGTSDEAALEAVLGTPVAYVGLVASRKRGEEVLKSLEERGVGPEARARLRFPAGLDIGALRGDEIAVSIIAEIVKVRRELGALDWEGEGADERSESGDDPDREDGATARDPICGMEVRVEGARHVYEHGGRTYYFCCAGCKQRFAAEPEAYLPVG